MQGFEGAMGGKVSEQAAAIEATPEQQAQYNKFVGMALSMLFKEDFLPKAVEAIKGSSTPVDGMARLGAGIASRLYDKAKQAGEEIEIIVMMHGGLEVMGEIAELANKAGIEVSMEMAEAAYYQAADMVKSHLENQGDLDGDDIEDFEDFTAEFGEENIQRALGIREQSSQATQQAMMGGR